MLSKGTDRTLVMWTGQFVLTTYPCMYQLAY